MTEPIEAVMMGAGNRGYEACGPYGGQRARWRRLWADGGFCPSATRAEYGTDHGTRIAGEPSAGLCRRGGPGQGERRAHGRVPPAGGADCGPLPVML